MPEHFYPIETLLSVTRPASWPVAVTHDQQQVNWADWEQLVATWHSYFMRRDEPCWAVYFESSLTFSAVLFALLHSGKQVVIAGNNQPGTQQRLAAIADGFAGEFDQDLVARPVIRHVPAEAAVPVTWQCLDSDACALTIFTSGSTGEPLTISKTLGQLSREVQTLQTCWGEQLAAAEVIATVSHQHIYGLLFRILWPLAAGRPFHIPLCSFSEEMINALTRGRDSVLVSSPSHLERLPDKLTPAVFGDRLQMVFSSTGPLSLEGAQRVARQLGRLPVEVFGSSETGGVAWRQQQATATPWQVLPGILVRAGEPAGVLELSSPHMPSLDWTAADDIIEMVSEGRFLLKARQGTVIKIEGKRASLTEIENQLLAIDMVRQARVVKLRNRRDLVGAVVVLTEQGRAQLLKTGKLQFNRLLSAALAAHFDAVVLPRRFRYTSHLPVNQHGKTTLDLLERLLGPADLKNKLPGVLYFDHPDELTWVLHMQIDPQLVFFDGHFAGHPVLPGVVMLFWAQYFGTLLFDVTAKFQSLRKVKFLQVVRPGDQLVMTINYRPKEHALNYSFGSVAGRHAMGTIDFQSSDANTPVVEH